MGHLEAKLDTMIDKLDARFDRLEAKLDRLDTRLSSDFTLIKWMLGLLLEGVLALILKAFFPI